MLVLTRKTGQKLIIANDIEITILETRGESVKIGIQAPKNIAIYREEVYDEIRKANQLANQQVKASTLDIAAQALQSIKPNPNKSNITSLSKSES
jgi:carbon storage regulator